MQLPIDSDYQEVPGPHRGSLRRELHRVYRGRFCFRLGAGVRCGGGASFTITEGETRSLSLSLTASAPIPGAPGASIGGGIEYTHTFAQQIGPWPVQGCDSIFPVLCFDDAELRIYRSRRPIRRYELSAFKEEFDPRGNTGWAHPNTWENDPLCPCHDAEKPTTVDTTATGTQEILPVIVIIRPITLLQTRPSDGERDDPTAAVQEAAQAIGEILDSDDGALSSGESVNGIARVDGVVAWLDGPPTSDAPSLVLLPAGISSMPRQRMTFDQGVVPIVAVGAPTVAADCQVTILARSRGEDELRELVREQAAVQVDERFTVVWYEADFGDLHSGASGFIELELRDANGEQIGYPLRESFEIDPLSTARVGQPA